MLTYDLSGGGQPKYYRLYTCIREDILRAELLPGQKLPSKRETLTVLRCIPV